MNKSDATGTQFLLQLADVLFHCCRIRVEQRIEAEYEIKRPIGDHFERAPVVREIRNIPSARKSLLADLDTCGRKVDNNQILAVVRQELRPATMPGGNFEDCSGGKKLTDSRHPNGVDCFQRCLGEGAYKPLLLDGTVLTRAGDVLDKNYTFIDERRTHFSILRPSDSVWRVHSEGSWPGSGWTFRFQRASGCDSLHPLSQQVCDPSMSSSLLMYPGHPYVIVLRVRPSRVFVVQLEEARAEWKRRHSPLLLIINVP